MNIHVIQKLINKENLTQQEAEKLVDAMVNREVSTTDIAVILRALHDKGETVDEIIGCIKAMRSHMLKVSGNTNAIDVCGTGGDGKGLFNISTCVAFVVAGAGVVVAKHGNRAASSTSGSGDVLEALGVNIMLTPEQAEAVLKNVGMVFLFAPLFHPAFKEVGVVRRQLGIRTIFNYIGPFANPAGVKKQLIGVPNLAIAEKLAEVAKQLEYDHVFIVTSEDGLDEISITAPTYMFEIKNKTIIKHLIKPEQYGFTQKSMNDLLGNSAQENAGIITHILDGKRGPQRDIVIFNSAYALLVAGKVKSVEEGIVLTEKAIESGAAKEVLNKLRKETQRYA